MTTTKDLLNDFRCHNAWADSTSWAALEAFPESFRDSTLWTRLHHIHMVQWAFLWIVRGNDIVRSRPEDFKTPMDMKAWGMTYHLEIAQWLESANALNLEATVRVPWFKGLELSRSHALVQATMHSHYHRAQNATRLRELGGEPKLTDFIAWIWNGRPEPNWK